MKVVDSFAMRAAPWATPVLTIGIFALDLLTPVGVAASVFYVTPLLLTFFCPRNRDPIYFSVVDAALIWVDLLIKLPLFQSLMACSSARRAGLSCGASC